MPPKFQRKKMLEEEAQTIYHHAVQLESVRLRREQGWSQRRAAAEAKRVGESARQAFLIAARARPSYSADLPREVDLRPGQREPALTPREPFDQLRLRSVEPERGEELRLRSVEPDRRRRERSAAPSPERPPKRRQGPEKEPEEKKEEENSKKVKSNETKNEYC